MPRARAGGARRAAAQGAARKRKAKEAEVLLPGKKNPGGAGAGGGAKKNQAKGPRAEEAAAVDKENLLDAVNNDEEAGAARKATKKAKKEKQQQKQADKQSEEQPEDGKNVEPASAVDESEYIVMDATAQSEADADLKERLPRNAEMEDDGDEAPQAPVPTTTGPSAAATEPSAPAAEQENPEAINREQEAASSDLKETATRNEQQEESLGDKAPPAPANSSPKATRNQGDGNESNSGAAYDSDETSKPLELDESAREQLVQVCEDEKLLFDKIQQETAINACLRDPNEVALEDMPRGPTTVETLFLELKGLRTTAAEFELDALRKIATARVKAQDAVIRELKQEIKALRAAAAAKAPASQQDETASLQRELAEARSLIVSLGGPAGTASEQSAAPKSQEETPAVPVESSEAFWRVKHELSAMKKVTGLSVEIEDEGKLMRCILKNKAQRKAVKYEFEYAPEDDGGIVYRPTGNLKYLPASMREELDVSGGQDLPALQALIQSELFGAAGSDE